MVLVDDGPAQVLPSSLPSKRAQAPRACFSSYHCSSHSPSSWPSIFTTLSLKSKLLSPFLLLTLVTLPLSNQSLNPSVSLCSYAWSISPMAMRVLIGGIMPGLSSLLSSISPHAAQITAYLSQCRRASYISDHSTTT